MVDNYEFQDKAVDFLLETSRNPKSKQTVVLKSPTGSGKTVVLLKFIDKYLNENNNKTAFVWLCPGKGDLEEQSKNVMLHMFQAVPKWLLMEEFIMKTEMLSF